MVPGETDHLEATTDAVPRGSSVLRWLVAAAVFLAIVGGAVLAREHLTLAKLVNHEQTLRSWQTAHPVLVFGGAFLLYAVVTGLSIPAASVLTLLFGWYFRFTHALVLVSFGSTTGATVAFLISRFLLRDWIQRRFGDRLARFNAALEREGAFYLFTLRLQPAVPFFVINAVMGVTPLRTWTFWWVSQLGMLPLTAVWVYAGSTAPDLATLAEQGTSGLPIRSFAIAFALLGLLPLAIRLFIKRLSKNDLELS